MEELSNTKINIVIDKIDPNRKIHKHTIDITLFVNVYVLICACLALIMFIVLFYVVH